MDDWSLKALNGLMLSDEIGKRAVVRLEVDAWAASSLMHKAIRRGEVEVAQSAALCFHRLRGNAIWRRLLVIAFEDIGVGSIDAVVTTVAAGTNKAWRTQVEGDKKVMLGLVRLLAEAPKDRSADYLISVAKDHPAFEVSRKLMGSSTLQGRIEIISDSSLDLPVRAIAAWYASGVEYGDERRIGPGDLNGVMMALKRMGVPDQLLDATKIAVVRTKEPIVLMVPLMWLEAFKGPTPSVLDCPVPFSPSVRGVPLYALDSHTAVGKSAIHRFAVENDAVRECLASYVADHRAQRLACLGAFYADAAPIALRLDWTGSAELERLGIAADMLAAGMPKQGISSLLSVVRDNLDHLNTIRARLFGAKTPATADREL